MDFDAFSDLAGVYLDAVPERFLLDRNGDPIPVIVEPQVRRRQDDPPGVYILGEYITTEYLPPQISLYYGSFARLFGAEPEAAWEAQLRETLLHEIRHHVEHMAGVYDLDKEDVLQLEQMWREARERRRE